MGDLTIDDIDDELMEALRKRADRNGRTVEDEVAAMIMTAFARELLQQPAPTDPPDPTISRP